jgi:N-acetylmuramoyl-L-alanine amidase
MSQRFLNPFFLVSAFVLVAFIYLLSANVVQAAATPLELQTKYKAAASGGPKVKILVMPGHEPNYGGTDYQGLYEREINVAIANLLAAQLRTDPRLEVVVPRTNTEWTPVFDTYFEKSWGSIRTFVDQHKSSMKGVTPTSIFQASHNAAPDDVALRLYGVTKWANENGVDLAIHVHLNDSGDMNQSGFAVYVPDAAFANGPTSRIIGTAIAYELNHYNATSSLAIENLGVTDDQELIALGAYNTANFPSVLVEYSYIYETKITNPTILPIVEKDFANSTYRGVRKFFGAPVSYYDTLTLPHRFTTTPKPDSTSAEVYSLQSALRRVNLYPPNGLYYDCPLSGTFGTCTVNALKAFQKSKGIEQTGTLGPKTRAALNAIWGGS